MPGHYYHIYNRSNNFFKKDNYLYFLRGVKKYPLKTMVIVAYCLMLTHYRMLVRV